MKPYRTVVACAAFALIAMCAATAIAQTTSFTCSMPAGWNTGTEKDTATMSATSPDGNVHVAVWKVTLSSQDSALNLARRQMQKLKPVKVLAPPTDMSRHAARFKADSVAKMHFTTLAFNQPDKKPVSYRAFVFVKGKTFVAIEAMATIKATEADFKAADAVIEGFRFN
ncbi:MAG TPA: hypothetical protein PKJ16_17935 [Spirochaetota bacterium]|nr:hypothetical protein [Spirochaetota bacterium]HOS41664.1 hypothetical protein [Spirochaetota bacterium]HPU89730.1 hypothetical protein [Spirochaetota bacterium]